MRQWSWHNRLGAVVLLTAGLSASVVEAQTTLRVPADIPTIQGAIDAAQNGDTVLVAPGTYNENIDFKGKGITVVSEQGSGVTIIDGGAVDSVAIFNSGESRDSVLDGFTLRNGSAGVSGGGGVRIESASPTVRNNEIVDNVSCTSGGGVKVNFASPLLEGNTIARNSQLGCSGGCGGGVYVGGAASAELEGNFVLENSWGSGGGICLFAAGTPTLRDNVISGNSASLSSGGGGLYIVNVSDALLVQNLIVSNSASKGGGIAWLVPSSGRGPLMVNNTVAGNDSAIGSGIHADGYDAEAELVNNIIVASPGQTAVYCGDFNDLNPPIFRFNNIYSASGAAYGGICGDQTGTDGNISADPLFSDPAAGEYFLQAASPSIDAGDNAAPNLPAVDLEGDPRIIDGDGDSIAVVDQGVDEALQPLPTPADAFCAGATAAVDKVTVSGSGLIDGDARSVGQVVIRQSGQVTGAVVENDPSAGFAPLALPPGLPSLGNINLSGNDQLQLQPGEFVVGKMTLKGSAEITVAGDASQPTILYLTNAVSVTDSARLNGLGDPAALILVQTSSKSASFKLQSLSAAALFAPASSVTLRDSATVVGSLVGSKVTVNGLAPAIFQQQVRCQP